MISFEEVFKKHTAKIRYLAFRVSRGFGGEQQLDELAAAGNLALWKCYQRFDSKRMSESDFWQYARRRVTGSMIDTLRSQGFVKRQQQNLDKSNALNRAPWAATQPVSIDSIKTLPSLSNPLEELMFKCDCNFARELVSELPPRLQYVIRMFYVENMPLAEIGDNLGVSDARICQLKLEALALMQEWAKERLWR